MCKQIVCQDTLDDDSSTGNGVVDRTENDLPREDLIGDLSSKADVAHEDTEYFDGSPDAYNSRKKELVGRRTVNSVHINVLKKMGFCPSLQKHHFHMVLDLGVRVLCILVEILAALVMKGMKPP